MRRLILTVLSLSSAIVVAGRARSAGATQANDIVALERAALDRWGRGDPSGFLEIYAPEITYFDVSTERRLDGHAAMTNYYRPITGKIKVSHYEMIGQKVQRHGDVAVLTYNLRSEGVLDGKPVSTRWNSTSVYVRAGSTWKVVHSHWSLTAHPATRSIS